MMVNDWGALVPPPVETVTVRAPGAAAASITKLTVIDVALCTVAALAVTPAPLIATVVAPVTNPAPVSVADTVDPAAPVAGAIVARVGAPVEAVDGPAGVFPVQPAANNMATLASAEASHALRRTP